MLNKLKLINEMAVDNGTKVVLLVMDGLGGLPLEPGGPTELEAAHTPNMDLLHRPVLARIIRKSSPPPSAPAAGPVTSLCSATTRSNS